MVYLISSSYSPNSATINRALAISKGLKLQGVHHKNIYMSPSINFDTQISNDCGEPVFLWKKWLWIPTNKNGLLNKIQRHFYFRCVMKFMFRHFLKGLDADDKVILLDEPNAILEITSDKYFFKKYIEQTEHIMATVNVFNVPEKQEIFYSACEKLDGIFVISNPLKQSYVEHGIDTDKITVVNMIVDRSRFEGLEKQQLNKPYIAYCGTVTNKKDGVDDLIRSFAIVAQENQSIQLYIIGKTPNKNEANSNLKLIKQLGLEDRINLTGIVKAEDMPQMLKNAEALLLARPDSLQAKNGFPTKLGEYLLTGNPVVITKTGDIPLYLKDGVSACLVEPGNCQEFAEKVLWALNNPNDAKEIGRKGKEVALKNFNYLIESKKIIEVITNGK